MQRAFVGIVLALAAPMIARRRSPTDASRTQRHALSHLPRWVGGHGAGSRARHLGQTSAAEGQSPPARTYAGGGPPGRACAATEGG
jgi:hypothetical protein